MALKTAWGSNELSGFNTFLANLYVVLMNIILHHPIREEKKVLFRNLLKIYKYPDHHRRFVDDLEKRVRRVEDLLSRYLENEYLRYIRHILASYLRLINIYMEYGKISPSIIFPEIKDPISREIIEILFSYGNLNTSQITEELKKSRGKASRRIVREKLNNLVEAGIVECEEKKNEKIYSISEYAVKKWLKVLGINIKGDVPKE